ncbi:MAG: hypothetical protein KKF78_11070 [Candidatus Omnitrophica bacterium]|nr:hypothetical protein [Candidatus Omnitrophota bacterium]MBU1997676.1 hypothetical protein [Candidatus Omnitrophota bacterium]
MRKRTIVPLFILFCTFANYSCAETIDVTIEKVRKKIGLNNIYSIEDIIKKEVTYGTYHTVGYVAKIYECPACPEGALCKPCMGENIVISHEQKELVGYDLGAKDLIVFVDDARSFKLGKKYLFLITVLDAKTTDQSVNNLKLIYSEILK